MKVLIVASEVTPIIKLGGLGDVIGSLPKALEKIGINVDVIVPYYPIAKVENLKIYKMMDLHVPFADETNSVEIYKTKLPDSNVDVLMLKNERYFSLGGVNAFMKDVKETEMFSFFSKAVVEYIKAQFNTYDLIHCHDWHTGLITHLLQDEIGEERPATLFTIHNFLYQGTSDASLVRELGIAPGLHPLIDYDIEDGDINLLYQGITAADYVNTVSESYAQEIKTRPFGGKMYQTVIDRQDRIVGILNGVDYSFFPVNYTQKNWQEMKLKHKSTLQKELGLEQSTVPMFSFISRLDPGQKGLDILYVSLEHILEEGGQFVLLGTGDKGWEEKFKKMSELKKYQARLSVNLSFNAELANNIYAASDFFMVPSKYEPCGLTQMIAMHYGALPIVRSVGGLKDSVIDHETGFVFKSYSSLDLNKAISRALKIYNDKDELTRMVENALKQDFSWNVSAIKYKDLYEKVINLRK